MTTDRDLASFEAARPAVRGWLEAMMTGIEVKQHGYALIQNLQQMHKLNVVETAERMLISLESLNVIQRTKQDFSYHQGIKTLGSFGTAGQAFNKKTTPVCFWFEPLFNVRVWTIIDHLNGIKNAADAAITGEP